MPTPVQRALLATLLAGFCCAGATRDVPEPFWTTPDSPAARQAATWREDGRTADATLMDRIAARPEAEWLNGPDPGP
ncbi:endoglucanase, partial [Streptomyces sp. W16]|nr:endoglucanase [Streptomyces sp. W16]